MPKRRMETSSDGELLEACRSGDTEAFAVLWDRHRGAAIVAARSLGPGLDPDDLVSEAYLKIFELVLGGRGPQGAFRPYLYQVIRTAAVDRYRSPERTNAELDEIPDLHEAGPWEDNAFDLNAVSQAFSSLDERWQAALWYTEVEQMPPRRAAALLGLSANAAAALAVRAREALRSSWVEAHVNRELAEAECRTTLDRLQRYQRGKLTARASREVAAHLDHCESCSRAAAASLALNRQLGLVLAGVLLGGVGAAGLFSQLGLTTQLGAATAAAASGASGFAAGTAGAASGGSSAGTGGAAGGGGAAAGGASAAGAAGAVAAPAAIITGVVAATAAIVGVAAIAISGLPTQAPAKESAQAQVQQPASP
ncbi:MAG: sigma-70 family RNA polymerase sigma factor, partial [Actinobacteria bacterium]|nr:sigma-70 family RNA polymerase sigma factor [Actinomycetota bacterium]